MDLGIAGKIALVSGGSRGIGREVARILADEGVRVVVAARSPEPVEETVAAITAAGGTATGVSVDMTDPEGIAVAVRTAQEAYGDPDIVISNVYGPGPGDFVDVTAEDFERVMREMTMSVIHLSKLVIPGMQKKGWGRLVNIGSGAAKEPPPELKHILANTARSSVVTLNKSLANEFGRDGITVNTIGTGLIATDRMWGYFGTQEAIDAFARQIPLRRAGKPVEIASVIAFLCSEPAGYVTGQLILVEGGINRSAF